MGGAVAGAVASAVVGAVANKALADDPPSPDVIAPKVPGRDSSEVQDAGRDERRRMRQGMASTILTGSDGVDGGNDNVRKKRLLGQ